MDCTSCKKCGSLFYDILTAGLSVLDVVTDVLVMVQFYNKGRIIFFIASLIILIIAHLSYILSFWGRHHQRNSPLLSISLFFLLIPFAPFISFFFYIVADENRYKLLIEDTCCLNQLIYNNPYTTYVDDDKSELKQWMQMKLYKHIGFIIESLFEAFPQSILQLIAFVYFGEIGDTISILMIISILLSMISVCSKTFVFAFSVAINIKSIIFTWLCCATDFISIFFTVSIIFYNLGHDPDLSDAFYCIQKIFYFKVLICVIPMTLIASIGVNLYCCIHYISYSLNHHNSCLHIISYCVTIVLFIQLIWIVVTCLMVMSMEVFCLIWFVLLFTEIGLNHRLSNSSSIAQQFYLRLIQWIKDAKSVKCDKTKFHIKKNINKRIRVFAINKVLLTSATQISLVKTEWHRNGRDDELLHFINDRQNNVYDIRWRDFRENTDDHNASVFWRKFWFKYYAKLWLKYKNNDGLQMKHRIGFFVSTLMTFILCPIYFASRLLNILFPSFVVLYLYFTHDIIFWYGYIDPFQVTTFCIYVLFLILSICVLFCSGILHEQYYSWHILPISQELRAPKNYDVTDMKFMEIVDYYDNIVYVPIITDLVNSKFSIDIGAVIMDYFYHILINNLHEPSCESDETYMYDMITPLSGAFDGDNDEKEETNSLLPNVRIINS